ncbi:cyclin-dependent kinase, partial [Emiliania huxleyi CCMP1516]|uniref:Protein kinase domain-containing protein n=2 Tax=Emiliania huxleyi TaxID=2903 RepID=A0A0D3J0L9_EMIH1
QVLQALAHCHAQGITHRNLKPKYIMLEEAGGAAAPHGRAGGALPGERWNVRISDFNSPYRAPEILLGSTHYTTAIDVWAAGCVFAEAASGQMLFVGDSDIGQLFKIFEVLGTPGAAKATPWRGVEALPHYNELFPNMPPRDWARFPALAPLLAQPDAADLLSRMLALDPTERISAAGALEHPFF